MKSLQANNFKQLFHSLNALKWKEVRLIYTLKRSAILPKHKSSAWRGMLGHVLKDKNPDLYQRIFDIQVKDHAFARRYSHAPNPYIVYIPSRRTHFEAGDRFSVRFTLIGEAVETLPILLPYLQGMGGLGLGPDEAALSLHSLTLHTPEPFPDQQEKAQRVGLKFQTPLRLRPKDMEKQPLPLPLIIHRLAERLALLAHFHCQTPLIESFESWIELAEKARISKAQISHSIIPRYSNRNKQAMNLKAITGYIEYREVDPFTIARTTYG